MLFLLAGCSTAPVAGTMDTIDKHHWQKRNDRDRDEDQPPPGVYGPASRTKPRLSDPPVDPPKDSAADPYDMPVQPARRRGKVFEPKDKVKDAPVAPASRTAKPQRDEEVIDAEERPPSRDRNRDSGRVLPPPALPASDERNDF